MGLTFINRVIKSTLILGALIFIFGSVYFDWLYSLGIFVGSIWGCANLWFIKQFVVGYVTPGQRDAKKLAILAVIKFPVLYIVGFLILRLAWFPVSAFVIGFSLVFAVILLKALGKLIVEGGFKNFSFTERRAVR